MIDITERPTKAKRIVVVQFKGEKPESFRTCPELYAKYTSKRLGICLHALWNVLSKRGTYENRLCRIKYQNIEQLKTLTWE